LESIDRARACLRAGATASLLCVALVSGAAAQQPAATPPPVTTPPPPAVPSARPSDAWAPGSQWLSLRFGYAKSGDENAANGNIGAGFGFNAMGKGMWSVGGYAHLEVLGRFGSATELEMPLTLEFARHSRWGSVVRPYFGLGGGVFFHKTYRTGGDEADMRPGFYFVGGINTAISDHSLLGFDVRTVFQGPVENNDPVFGSGDPDVTRWSVKVNYSRVN
jgi:hypothetical protein